MVLRRIYLGIHKLVICFNPYPHPHFLFFFFFKLSFLSVWLFVEVQVSQKITYFF